MSVMSPVFDFLSCLARVPRGASFAPPLLIILICSGCVSSGGGVEPVDDPPLAAVTAPTPVLNDLPYTSDTLDQRFIAEGRGFLLATARGAMDELRDARVPSYAFPGELLADVIPPEVIEARRSVSL